jgi:cell division septum initiation protein DivIVA
MDFLVLLDQLDDAINNAKPVPLSTHVRVDKEEIYEILDEMRATIPDEIRQARRMVREREEMLGEARRMVEEAREASASSSLGGAAAEQVRAILEAAERTAAEIRSTAESDAEHLTRAAQREAEEARRDAEQRATETIERTGAEAAAHLERVQEAARRMLDRAGGVESELDGLVGNVRASIGSLVGTISDGAGSLYTGLERMRSELSPVVRDAPARGELAPFGVFDERQLTTSNDAQPELPERRPPAGSAWRKP